MKSSATRTLESYWYFRKKRKHSKQVKKKDVEKSEALSKALNVSCSGAQSTFQKNLSVAQLYKNALSFILLWKFNVITPQKISTNLHLSYLLGIYCIMIMKHVV